MSTDNNPNLNQKNTPKTEKRGKLTTRVPSGLGKLPPQAIDLEEAVLGALMLEKDALSAVIDILKPDIFYVDAHQKIFQAIQVLFQTQDTCTRWVVTRTVSWE